jgi:hypothetical protein
MKKIKYIEKQVLFIENQRFRQIWIRIGFVLMPVATLLYALLYTTNSVNQFGNSKLPGSVVILLGIIFGIALPLLFYVAELRVRITSDGVLVKFFPFQLSWEFYSYSEIKTFEKVQYHPLREYGGWGIRYGLHGKAYNVSGNMGIRLTFLNGKKLLIGSQKSGEFESVLQKIKNGGS